METKQCAQCKKVLPRDAFYLRSGHRGRSGNVRAKCKDCCKAKTRKPGWYQRRRWGQDVVDRLKATERCQICDQPKPLVVDHCHHTEKVRGFLCTRCNTGLGKFEDDPKLLKAAIKYLTRRF